MGKVNLFGTMLSAVLTVSLLTASPIVAAAKTAKPAKKSAKAAKVTKVKPDRLGMLTFAQVARLNDRMRREYIATLRQATLDVDMFQRKFNNKTYGSIAAGYDIYAMNDSAAFGNWLMEAAHAATNTPLPVNRCLHAGNISQYPEAAFRNRNCTGEECEPGRVEGQCQGVPCAIGGRSNSTTGSGANAGGLRGSTCNFVASGMVNQPGRGCMNNNAVENARFAKTCDDRRNELARENQSAVDTLVRETNEYFGFNPGGSYRSDTCKSEGSKNLFNRLIQSSYSNDAYAMLIKAAYFCKSNGQGLPDGLTHYNGSADAALGFNALEQDFNNLSKAVDDIFSGYIRHCPSPLTDRDVRALRAKLPAYERDGTIAGARRGSDFYYQERQRLEHLRALDPSKRPTHINVLEVEECRLLQLRWTDLKTKIGDIAGTYPRIADENPPPPIPPAPPNEAVKVFPTGCTEAVTREGSQLAQPVSRCMPCLIQTTENIKDRASSDPAVQRQAGTYRASRKYISLVNTMALACGDGYLHDSVLTTEMAVDYLHAFAYCKSETYEWDNENSNEQRLAMQWGDQRYWRERDGKADDPGHSNQFREVYGISYKDAKDMFCSEGRRGGLRGRNGYTPTEKRQLLRSRRESFERGRQKFGNGSDREYSGALADCMSEASRNAAAFNRDSRLCIGFDSFQRGETPQYTQMRENFLTDPAIVDFDNGCAIPKQMEEYHTKMTNTGSVSVCDDGNSDGKDDRTQAPCSAGQAYQCIGFVDARDASLINDKSCAPPTKPGQTVFTFSDANLPGSTARYTYRTGSTCDISAGDVRRAPEVQRGAQ